MFLGLAPFVVALVSTAVSIASSALIGAISRPKQEKSKGRIPGSALGKSIPEGFNTFVVDDIMWVEPATEGRAFFYREKNKVQQVYLTAIGVLGHCLGGAKIVTLDVAGERQYAEGGDRSFLDEEVSYNEGLDNQMPFRYWIEEYGVNNLCAYRGLITLGFYSLGVHYKGRGNSFPTIRMILRSNITYSVGDILKKKAVDAGINANKIDISEVASEPCQGFTCDRSGGDYLSQIEPLLTNHFIGIVELPNGVISFRKIKRPKATVEIPLAHLGAREEGQALDTLVTRTVEESRELPRNIMFSFIDTDNGWENGNVESDFHPLATGNHIESISTNEALTRAEAKVIANKLLYQVWDRRVKYEFTLPFEYKATLVPLDVVIIGGKFTVQIINISLSANWLLKCEAFEYEATSFNFSSSGINAIAVPSNNAPPPTPVAVSDNSIIQNAEIILLDAPLAFNSDTEVGVYAFSNTKGRVYLRSDGESQYLDSGEITSASTYGTCNTVLGYRSKTINGTSYPVNFNLSADTLPLIDNTNTLTVTLSSGAIASLTQSQFDNEEVLLFVGKQVSGAWQGEYICANVAVGTGNNIILSQLKRGLRGTEYYLDKHTTGESIFLIQSAHPRIALKEADINQSLSYKLQVFDTQDVSTIAANTVLFQAQGLFGYAPTNLDFDVDPTSGELNFRVLDRSRLGELQVGEGLKAQYELYFLRSDGSVARSLASYSPKGLRYAIAEQTADNLSEPFNINVYRVNSVAGRGFVGVFRQIGSPDGIINITGTKNGTGQITLSWQSRNTYTGDYRVEILDPDTFATIRSQITTSPSYIYSTSLQNNDFGSVQENLTIRVARSLSSTVNGNFTTAKIEFAPPEVVITDFTPKNVEVGAVVTVTGNNLAMITKVEVNEVSQLEVTPLSNQSLSFKIAPNTISGRIKLSYATSDPAVSTDSLFILENNFIFLVNRSYNVPGDFPTLSQAIAFLSYKIVDNVAIRLLNPVYNETIEISNLITMSGGLRIKGLGINSTTINGSIDISAPSTNLIVEDLSIDPTSSNLGIGIRCRNKANLTVKNTRVKDFQIGISLGSTSSASIDNCLVSNCSIYGVHASSSSIASVSNTTVTNCEAGFSADNSSTIVANGCISSNNSQFGFKAEINSVIYAFNTAQGSVNNAIATYNVAANATPNQTSGIIFLS